MRRTSPLAAVLLLLTVLAATAFAAPISRDDYIAKVDPICKSAREDFLRAGVKAVALIKDGKLEKGLHLLGDSVRDYRDSFREVDRVRPPRGDERQIHDWLTLEKKDTEILSRYVQALKTGDVNKARSILGQRKPLAHQIKRTIGNYGFHFCAPDRTRSLASSSSR